MSKLRLYRQRRGATLEDVGKFVGVGMNTVWRWEAGRLFPRRYHLESLARYYGCKVGDLFDDSPTRFAI